MIFARGTESVEIVEVGPRDGFQMIEPWIPTARKLSLVRGLHAAGLRRMELGSFVSPSAVPQLADTRQLFAEVRSLAELDAQILVASERRALEAVAAGVRHLVFVLSVSESHNRSNVRRTPRESVEEYGRLIRGLPDDVRIRIDIATSFDCPFEGKIAERRTLRLVEDLIALRVDVEVALCDTTGRVAPDHVQGLLVQCRDAFPQVRSWAFHGHDTYGMGIANVVAAWQAGVSVIDASFGGLGGCPFAPGATGNVATEDLVWLFDRIGVKTNVDLDALTAVARDATALPGAQPGGRVRIALAAARDFANAQREQV